MCLLLYLSGPDVTRSPLLPDNLSSHTHTHTHMFTRKAHKPSTLWHAIPPTPCPIWKQSNCRPLDSWKICACIMSVTVTKLLHLCSLLLIKTENGQKRDMSQHRRRKKKQRGKRKTQKGWRKCQRETGWTWRESETWEGHKGLMWSWEKRISLWFWNTYI